ncbi:putative transcriptional regulator AsnC family [Candidatus Nitrosocosmicus arcticus]|uniref:Putative transcriptional regulator AsnC family n=1 Tax=Candidatus Nitrosocosmicus arcticus TaxID=2035267 RepID=A0A557SWT7_9ARCH|nr:putative transcriptional regulator AsnC family [Candidatus Nitrosocosmicus arcticus]
MILICVPFAYVLINCELGSENEIMEKIRKVPEVVDVYRVFGVYDIIVRISSNNMETLKEIITWKIKKLDEVRSALSMIVIEDLDKN